MKTKMRGTITKTNRENNLNRNVKAAGAAAVAAGAAEDTAAVACVRRLNA